MGKYVYKFKAGDPWDIEEQESWFSDMAKEGLILYKVGKNFATFRKDSPQKTKYRIIVFSEANDLNEDQKKSYKEKGWFLVDNRSYFDVVGGFYVFSSPEELNAPELHSNLDEQSCILKDLKKSQKQKVIITILGVIAYLAMLFYIMYKDGTLYLTLLNYDISFQILIPLIGAYWVFRAIKDTLIIEMLRKKLSQGISLDHNVNWRKSLLRRKITSIILGVVFIILLIDIISMNKVYFTKIKVEENDKLPIVTLTELEGTSSITRTGVIFDKNPKSVNWYTKRSNFFSILNYETHEHGKIQGKEAYIVSNVYQIRFKNYADEVVKDLVNKYGGYGDLSEVENPNFDSLYISKGKGGFYLIACKGRGIIYLYYGGDARLDKGLNLVNEKLKIIK